MTIASLEPADAPLPLATSVAKPPRFMAVDALRGFVMLVMIFVNDLDPDKSLWWMKHYSDTGFGPNGMTFVDMVFPAFIFIVGMSIPLAFTARLARGESVLKLAGHVLLRTVSLLAVGIMMVNGESHANRDLMPMSKNVWEGLMFVCAILSFCSIAPRSEERGFRIATWVLRCIGLAGLVYLAVIYSTGKNNVHILNFKPHFWIRTEWYGILGLIGWAYLMASIVFGLFRTRRLPILTCIALMFCLYALDKNGAFANLHWLRFISVGEMLGTHAAIATAGLLLGTTLLTADTTTPAARIRFALWFALGFAVAAVVIHPPLPAFKAHPPLWGISKNAATPAWGLWACAVTAVVWVIFYTISDVWNLRFLIKPWAIAGQNVLLAYLLSEGMESWLSWLHLSNWYDNLSEPDLTHAILRSVGCGVVILAITAMLNWLGFWMRL